MGLIKYASSVYVTLAGLAIAAVVVGEAYKIAWMTVWLAPILTMLCFVSIATLSHRPDTTAGAARGKVASYAKVTAFGVLVYLFITIEVVSDAPVTLRLMGLSMTTSGHAASRFLVIGGLVIGALGTWLSVSQVRREAAAAALAERTRGQTPSVPPAGSTT